jgi:type VI secretion system secreted protein VgrG
MVSSNLRNLSILATAFLATAFNIEWNGYESFEKKDGSNFLCDIDPQCRYLTENEIKLAEQVYGDAIDYKGVKVFNRSYLFLPDIFNDRSHAPNGNIYISDTNKRSIDLSEKYSNQTFLIHELGHVWQFHNGKDPRLSAIFYMESDNLKINYKPDYDYKFDENLSFHDYNLEQQASIFEDYYIELNRKHRNLIHKSKLIQLQKLVSEALEKGNKNNELELNSKPML